MTIFEGENTHSVSANMRSNAGGELYKPGVNLESVKLVAKSPQY